VCVKNCIFKQGVCLKYKYPVSGTRGVCKKKTTDVQPARGGRVKMCEVSCSFTKFVCLYPFIVHTVVVYFIHMGILCFVLFIVEERAIPRSCSIAMEFIWHYCSTFAGMLCHLYYLYIPYL
jgi:hypothetical protein